MSRIGKKIINVPAGVTVTVAEGNVVTVKGPKGELTSTFNTRLTFNVEATTIEVVRPSDSKEDKTIHGTTRALLNNMVIGVSEGFKKNLTITGVGYRAQIQGKKLTVNAGYSNPVEIDVPEGLTVECPKNTEINIMGINKQVVGEFAAYVRGVRGPEPYKGKGIRYVDEVVRRKEGKTAKK